MTKTALRAVFSITLTLLSNHASAQMQARSGADAIRAAASIVDIKGPAPQRWILRNGSKISIEASRGEFLYPGDEISVRGQNVEVDILPQGALKSLSVRESNSPYRVGKAASYSISDQAWAFLSAVRWPWAQRNPAARSRSYVKGDSSPDLVARSIRPVSFSPAVPGTVLAIPVDQENLTISWCGDASYVQAYTDGRDVADVGDEDGIGRVKGLASNGADRVRVMSRTDASYLEFVVRRVDRSEIPRPDWLKTARPADAVERSAWGVWLLTQGPAEYRAFGLTLLDESKFDSPAAAQYFGAAVDCPR